MKVKSFSYLSIIFCLLFLGMMKNVNATETYFFGVYTNAQPAVVKGGLNIEGGIQRSQPLTIEGDLIITNSYVSNNVSIWDSDLIVKGDLITNNPVNLNYDTGPPRGSLYVGGDLIITSSVNHYTCIDITGGELFVKGDIICSSESGSSTITVRIGFITANNITAASYSRGAFIKGANIMATGSITTRSNSGYLSYIEATSGYLRAKSLSTFGRSESYIKASEKIEVVEDIQARTEEGGSNGYAYVSTPHYIKAKSITTNGWEESYIYTGQRLEITEDITVKSQRNHAYIYSDDSITAKNISTSALASGRNAYVSANSFILANNITTSADNNSYVSAGNNIDSSGGIKTFSLSGDCYITAPNGIHAFSLSTHGHNYAYAQSTLADINVTNEIITKSSANDAFIAAHTGITAKEIFSSAPAIGKRAFIATSAFILANNITTSSDDISTVSAGTFINVSGDIKTFSNSNNAYVKASTDIHAFSIATQGYLDSYIESTNGSIFVTNELIAKSKNQDANIYSNYNIKALNISADAYRDSMIVAENDLIVTGDIISVSATRDGGIQARNNIVATNINTDAVNVGNIHSVNGYIYARGDITGQSSTQQAHVSARGNITANNITTNTVLGGSVISYNGKIDVNHKILAQASSLEANISAATGIETQTITIDANQSAVITCTTGDISGRSLYIKSATEETACRAFGGNIKFSDIELISDTDFASLATTGSIMANDITVSAYGNSGIQAFFIDVVGDITIFSNQGEAYIETDTGIPIRSVIGVDNVFGIKAGNVTIDGKLASSFNGLSIIDNQNNIFEQKLLKDAYFMLAQDQILDHKVEINGTCTIDGVGNTLQIINDGKIFINKDANLTLKNLIVDTSIFAKDEKIIVDEGTLFTQDVITG